MLVAAFALRRLEGTFHGICSDSVTGKAGKGTSLTLKHQSHSHFFLFATSENCPIFDYLS